MKLQQNTNIEISVVNMHGRGGFKIYHDVNDKIFSIRTNLYQLFFINSEIGVKQIFEIFIDGTKVINDDSKIIEYTNKQFIQIQVNFLRTILNEEEQKLENHRLLNAISSRDNKEIHYSIWCGADVNKGIFRATFELKLDVVVCLLEHKANANAEDVNHITPLILATRIIEKQLDIVKFLIEYNADINYSKSINTPLISTILRNNKILVEYLICCKASVNLPNSNRYTPLRIAIQLNNRIMVKFILESKANVDALSKGQTPLMYSVSFNYLEIVKLLIKYEAEIYCNKRDPLLFRAVNTGCLEMVDLLLKNGANTEIDNSGITPWNLAMSKKQTEIAYLLTQFGAETTVATYNEEEISQRKNSPYLTLRTCAK